MTYVLFPAPLYAPFPASSFQNSALGGNNILVDAAGEKAAFIFRAGGDLVGTLDKLIWATNAITGACTIDMRVETVDDTTGDPTGTLAWANATASRASLASNTTYEDTLTASGTLVAGTLYAIVFVYNAGTSINIACEMSTTAAVFPYGDQYTGTWAKQTGPPVVALKVGGVYFPISMQNWANRYSTAFVNSSSTPDERGSKFTIPVKQRAVAVQIIYNINNAAANFDLVLYNAADGVIETISVDASDLRFTTTGGYHIFPLSTKRDIEANTIYRIVIKPTTTTATSGNLPLFAALSAAHMAAQPGRGSWYRTERTDGGAWTDTTTDLYPVGLVFDAIDIPASGIAQLIGEALLA